MLSVALDFSYKINTIMQILMNRSEETNVSKKKITEP